MMPRLKALAGQVLEAVKSGRPAVKPAPESGRAAHPRKGDSWINERGEKIVYWPDDNLSQPSKTRLAQLHCSPQ